MSNHTYSGKQAVAEATPATAAIVFGATFDHWLKVAGLVFLVLQIGYLIWRWRRDIRRDRESRPPMEDAT